LNFSPTLQAHTNYDTTEQRGLDSRTLYGDPARHKRARIINELRENADQKSPLREKEEHFAFTAQMVGVQPVLFNHDTVQWF
jgi:hypothetical protein